MQLWGYREAEQKELQAGWKWEKATVRERGKLSYDLKLEPDIMRTQ